MSLWDGIGRTLVTSFSGGRGRGKATIYDTASPSTPGKTVDCVVVPAREDSDAGVRKRDLVVQLSGAALGGIKMNDATPVEIGGVQYKFEPIPSVGITDPEKAAMGNSPIVQGILSAGGR